MQPVLTPGQELLERTIREFLAETSPLVTVRGWSEDLPAGYPDQWWRQACELGWIWLCLPERLGGAGVSEGIPDLLLLARQVGAAVAPGPVLGSSLLCLALADGGDSHDGLMEELADGSATGAWCLSEASFFPGARAGALRAEPDGDGYRITGTSCAAEYAAQATHLLVTAATPAGAVQAVVTAGTPGVRVSPRSGIDLTRRFGVVHLDGVRVPRPAVLADGAAGARQAEWLLDVALAWQCAETVGAIEHIFATTLHYLSDRYAFGRPLASYQALKHRVADMKVQVEACAATAAAAGAAACSRDARAPDLASAAKSYIGDHACPILQEAVQLHGGIALTWEHDLHYYLRRATQNRSMYGDPARHRRRLAAAAGLPAAQ